MVAITISNDIKIKGPTPAMLEYCRQNLILNNPEFEKKERLGLWTGNTPRKLSLYKMDAGMLIVPVGAFKGVLACLTHEEYTRTKITSDLADNGIIDYGVSIDDFGLYDYQERAVNELVENGYGILESKAGSGKTQIGVALIATLGVKTLWLTHTQDLLKQSYDRASRYIDKSLLGTITAGKVDIGKGITFATVQTLSRQDMAQYRYTWDCVIIDEVHRCAGTPTSATMFSKVVANLAAGHKYGLSATVHRADGLIKSTFALVGGVAYTVPDADIADKVMQVTVRRCNTCTTMSNDALDTDGTIIYTRLINSLCENVDRNKFIVDNLTGDSINHYNLVLSDRVEHLKKLYRMLPGAMKVQSVVIDGRMKKDAREKALEDMREGKKRYLFATYKLAKEGLDIPRLDRLHMVTPQKDYAIIVQSVGRIARKLDGKDSPICYDYVDDIGMLEGFYKKRVSSYKKCGCKGSW